METARSDHFVTINDDIEYERSRFILSIFDIECVGYSHILYVYVHDQRRTCRTLTFKP